MLKIRSKLIGDAAIYTLSNFSVAGVPFLLLPILTRALPPDAYGMVAMFSVVVPIFAVGAGLNCHGAIMVRFFDSQNFHIPTYVSTCLLLLLCTTGTMFLIVILFRTPLTQLTSLPLEFLLLAALVAGLQFVVQSLLVLWQSSKQPVKYASLRLLHAVSDGSASVLLVVLFSYSWQGRITGMALAWCMSAAIALVLLRKYGWLPAKFDSACAHDALGYGVPLVPHAIGGIALGMADRLMVNSFLDLHSTGIYIVAVQIGAVLGLSADALNRAFAPWLMESLKARDYNRDRKVVTYTYAYFLLITGMALVAGFAAPSLIAAIAGDDYLGATQIVNYILIGNAFTGMYYMVTNYIFYARRTGLLSSLTIAVGSITIALMYVLIQKNGLIGAAQAFLIGQFLLFAGAWILANACHSMPWLLWRKR